MDVLRFKNDTPMRRKLWTSEAFSHPAKGHCGMWQEMILRYSKEGDWLLDPMAGVGTTLLGALMGRNCCLIELESHFVEPMRRSWAKMQTMPMLGFEMGSVVILRGDARCLPLLSADTIITSPPYEGSLVLEQNGIDASQLKQPYGPNSQFARPQSYTRPPR